MGFSKLREWVGTVTGKVDRWGRDRLGRSKPAFLSASTIVLPPLTCTARREAGQLCRQLLLCCETGQLLAVFLEAFAGRRIHRLCPPAVACSAGCVPARLCHAMPTALRQFAPVLFILLCPCSFHVRQDRHKLLHQVCKLQDCPVGSCNTGLQWRPVRRFICDFLLLFLFAESMILGHG